MSKKPRTRHIVERTFDDKFEIHNPNINDVEIGNMIRIKEPRRREWGTIVIDVDFQQNAVLVRDNIGGTKEFEEWTHIDNVRCTWNIGGSEYAFKLIDAFNGHFESVIEKQQEVLNGQDQTNDLDDQNDDFQITMH